MTVRNVPGRMSSAQNQLLFKATLPALGFNTYYFQSKEALSVNVSQTTTAQNTDHENCTLENAVCLHCHLTEEYMYSTI